MRPNRRTLWTLAGVATVGCILAITVNWLYWRGDAQQPDQVATAWRAASEKERARIARVLKERGGLIGASYEQVQRLLGAPTRRELEYVIMEYVGGEWQVDEFLLVQFDDHDRATWVGSAGPTRSPAELRVISDGAVSQASKNIESKLREVMLNHAALPTDGDSRNEELRRLRAQDTDWLLIGRTRDEVVECLGPPDIELMIYYHAEGSIAVNVVHGHVVIVGGDEYPKGSDPS